MDRARQTPASRWIDRALIVFATFAVWMHTVSFEFVWDDQQFIVENRSIHSLVNLPAMLSRRDAQSSMPDHFILYRPVRTVAYALLNQLGGRPEPRAAIFHLANVVGHALAAILLSGVSFRLLQMSGGASESSARIGALFIGLAFAVHPVVSEVVCWAKSFDDILATLFCLGALSQLGAWREGQSWRLASAIVLFALAVYSKESAVPFALIPFVYFWLLLREPFARSAWLSSGFVVVAAVFVFHRHLVLGQTSQTAPISGSYAQTLIDTIPCAATYLRLGLGIPPFNIDYAFLERRWLPYSLPVLLGTLVLASSAAAILLAVRSERFKTFGFGLLWAALFFVPVSNIVPTMQLMAERFLYLPLAGLLLAGGSLLSKIQNKKVMLACACTPIVIWSIVAWERSWIWHDDLTLFVQTAVEGPRNPVMEGNATASILNLPSVKKVTQPTGSEPPSRDDIQLAIRVLTTARKAIPAQAGLANALGACWARANDFGKAIACFRDAAVMAPKNVTYARNLGHALVEDGKLPEANDVLRKLLAVHPDDIPLRRMLCGVLVAQKQYDEAMPLLTRLKQDDPNSPVYDQWLQQIEHGRADSIGVK